MDGGMDGGGREYSNKKKSVVVGSSSVVGCDLTKVRHPKILRWEKDEHGFAAR